MSEFKRFGLPEALLRALERMGYTEPTPIQNQAIPLALEGRDILGSAQTGTGKTAAFGIPLVNKLMQSPRGIALVLTPTRELAVQVLSVINDLLKGQPTIGTALVIGGESMPAQVAKLRMRPRVIVGTPGRINDHLERGSLMLHEAGFLVLDETDRMLDLGFEVQIERIVKFLPRTRQTLMFSATIPDAIVRLSSRYLANPARVAVDPVSTAAPKIRQEIVRSSDATKYADLVKELNTRTGSIIVFVKTKRGAERLAQRLTKQNHSADAIHGDLVQRQRDRVIAAFREKRHRIMVATDIAARGLDIPHIEHVINYDLPQCAEDYIHRIGRTARAGAEGASVCLLTAADERQWKVIHKLLHPEEKSASQPSSLSGSDTPGKSKPRQRRRGPRSGGGGQGGTPPTGGGQRSPHRERTPA